MEYAVEFFWGMQVVVVMLVVGLLLEKQSSQPKMTHWRSRRGKQKSWEEKEDDNLPLLPAADHIASSDGEANAERPRGKTYLLISFGPLVAPTEKPADAAHIARVVVRILVMKSSRRMV